MNRPRKPKTRTRQKKATRRIQQRIAGVRRLPSSANLLPELKDALSYAALEEGCSEGWINAFALGQLFDIAVPDYRIRPRLIKRA